MSIDRVLFCEYMNNYAIDHEPHQRDIFELRESRKRKEREHLSVLANQVFNIIEKKQKKGAIDGKFKLCSSDEKQQKFVFSFLNSVYRISSEIQKEANDIDDSKRQRIETPQETFKNLFDGYSPLGFFPPSLTSRVWKVNWAENQALLKYPKPKPLLPLPQYPTIVAEADKELNLQRQRNELSDVTFAIGDNYFPVHRIILANRSPYFSRMLQSGMKESQSHHTFEIKEVSAKCFNTYLTSIYTQQPPQGNLSFEFLLELTGYANLTEVQLLYRWCVIELTKKLSPDTFYTVAMQAYKMNDKGLLDYCQYFFCQNEKTLTDLEIDINELSLTEIANHLALGLYLTIPPLIKTCTAKLTQELAKDTNGFTSVCAIAIDAPESLANVLKPLLSDYVKTHKNLFESKERKENKEQYKKLMSGLS